MKDVIKYFYWAYKKIPRVLTLGNLLMEMTFLFLRSLAEKMLDIGNILWPGKHSSLEGPVEETVWRRKYFRDSFEDEEGRTAREGVHKEQWGVGHIARWSIS